MGINEGMGRPLAAGSASVLVRCEKLCWSEACVEEGLEGGMVTVPISQEGLARAEFPAHPRAAADDFPDFKLKV